MWNDCRAICSIEFLMMEFNAATSHWPSGQQCPSSLCFIPFLLCMFPLSARTWRLSLFALTLTWTSANKPLVYLGASRPTDALLVCQCTSLLFWSLRWTLGASQRRPQCTLCSVRNPLLFKPSLPPSPRRGAPPPQRARSCGYRTGALPVNKINQREHQGGNKKLQRNKNTKKQLVFTSAVSAAARETEFRREGLSSCLVTAGGATFLPI